MYRALIMYCSFVCVCVYLRRINTRNEEVQYSKQIDGIEKLCAYKIKKNHTYVLRACELHTHVVLNDVMLR